MKVRCVDATKSNRLLTAGAVYTVMSEDNKQYRLAELPVGHNGWRKDRFQVIAEPARPVPAPTAATAPRARSAVPFDPIEERYRAILTGPRPGECACGIPRHQCDYHR